MGGSTASRDGKKQLWSYQTKEASAQAAYLAAMEGVTKCELIDGIVAKEISVKFNAYLSGLVDKKAEEIAAILVNKRLKELLETLAIKVGIG